MKHIIKVENFDNLSGVRPLIAMVRGASGEPEFSIKEPRTIITGTWDISKTNNTKEVLIRGEVTLNGKTDCYSLTFEAGGHLTINAGARLRVWQGGIVNNDCTTVNYLTIVEDSVNDSYGEFLLHPDVTVNNHPLGTVKYISYSYRKDSGDYLYLSYGNLNTLTTVDNIDTINPTSEEGVMTAFFYWNGSRWTSAGYLHRDGYSLDYTKINTPFIDYQLLHNTPNTGTIVLITGQLYGNIDKTITNATNILTANGFGGKIKTQDYLNILQNGITFTLKCMGGNITITPQNIDQYPYLYPTNAFIIQNQTVNYTLSYKDLVWDPSFEEEVTPTRSLMKGALTTVKPVEIDTTLEGYEIFDNPELAFPLEQDER